MQQQIAQIQQQDQQKQNLARNQALAAAALQQGNFQAQSLQRLAQQGMVSNQGLPQNLPQNLGALNAAQASAVVSMQQGGSGTGVGPMTVNQQARVQQALAAQNGGMAPAPSAAATVDSPTANATSVASMEAAFASIERIDAERRSKVFEV